MTPPKKPDEPADGQKGSSCECGCSPGCRVEAVLSLDERGQMVLPKDVREKAGIRNGDKLALISWERDGAICCLALMKADNLNAMVRDILGPMLELDKR